MTTLNKVDALAIRSPDIGANLSETLDVRSEDQNSSLALVEENAKVRAVDFVNVVKNESKETQNLMKKFYVNSLGTLSERMDAVNARLDK
jgi:hypothetical protein